LATGYYDDGRLMSGWQAHTDMLNSPSDSWRNILAVITGDRDRIRPAGRRTTKRAITAVGQPEWADVVAQRPGGRVPAGL
jgi:hypothetical protein